MPNMLTLKGKRKLLVAGTALVMSFVLALIGKLEGPQWVTVTSFIVGLYAAGNVGEHVAANGNDT